MESWVSLFAWMAYRRKPAEHAVEWGVLQMEWLKVSTAAAVLLLGINLYTGTTDALYVILTLLQAVVCAALLAVDSAGNAPRELKDTPRLALAAVALQCAKLLVAMLYGCGTALTSFDLVMNMVSYSILTSIACMYLDARDHRNDLKFPSGWLMWTTETGDAMSLVAGFVQFAAPGMEASWAHHFVALLYFTLVSVFILSWGATCGHYFAELLPTISGGDGSEESAGITELKRTTQFVLALDFATDLPICLTTVISGTYVGNLGLSVNVVFNIFAIFRAVFVWGRDNGTKHPQGYTRAPA